MIQKLNSFESLTSNLKQETTTWLNLLSKLKLVNYFDPEIVIFPVENCIEIRWKIHRVELKISIFDKRDWIIELDTNTERKTMLDDYFRSKKFLSKILGRRAYIQIAWNRFLQLKINKKDIKSIKDDLLSRIDKISEYPENWDGNDAKKPLNHSVVPMRQLTKDFLELFENEILSDWVDPLVVADPNGYVQFEFFNRGRYLFLCCFNEKIGVILAHEHDPIDSEYLKDISEIIPHWKKFVKTSTSTPDH